MKAKISQRRRRFTQMALGVILAISTCSLLLSRLSGWQLLSVQSNSMLPALRPGDAVIVTPIQLTSLQPGDIVSYRDITHPNLSITHRVIDVNRHRSLVIAKGDNVVQADRSINQQLLVGRMDHRIPKIGFLLDFLRCPAGLVIGTYFPAILLAGLEMRRLSNVYSQKTYRLRTG